MIQRFLITFLAALALPFAALAQAPEYRNPETVIHEIVAPAADPWPFAASDLPVDPDYVFGVLDSGFRYIIRPNGTPAGQGMVYLWVNSGSMGEDADQGGYAHFLEHMAFNGSTSIPEGEMIPLLEREGLAFGPDTNASTTFDRTIYQLNLPRNDPELLETAIMLMRETASELTLYEEAVQREIGVIQAERRVRDTYALRNTLANLNFLYPGSQFAERWIGGTDETIDNASSARLRDYYERWYRPDNAALIVVGAFDPAAAEALVREYFADWSAPPVEPANDGGPIPYELRGLTEVHLDPALSEGVTISAHGTWQGEPDTIASRQRRLLRQIGYNIVNRRLQSLSRSEDPPFRVAGLTTEEIFHVARSTSLIVRAAEGEWQRGLAAAQEEYRRALLFGFSESEVAEQVAILRTAIESNAAGAATRNNRDFITGALTLLADGQVPTTPESARERFESYADDITPAAVLEALLVELVPLDDGLIRFTGRTAPEGRAEALRAAWNEGMARELQPREEEAAAEFAYQDFGTPGEVASDEAEPLLGIRRITFANGVMLNLKRTELEQDRIAVQVNVDGGELLDTREDPLASAMFNSLIVGGLGAHTLDELQTILAGRSVDLRLDATNETFRFSGTTTPRDLEMQLQVFAAAISDPAYRSTGEEQYRRNVANWFARREATPDSALSTAQGRIISDGDPRFSLQPEESYMQLTFAGLREDIEGRLDHGAIEIALVGDIDENAAIALVARTFGALPVRETAFGAYVENRQRSFTADRSPRLVTHQGEANQAILRMIWPTRDATDLGESLQLELLQRVMQLRLLETLREELGQTYSPTSSASQSWTWPGWGTFTIGAEIDTSHVDAARQAMLETLASLRAEPADEDLLLRARAPQLEAYDNLLKTNRGWMGLVDRAQTQPDRIERFTIGKQTLEAITAADVQEMALRYLDPEQRLEVTVLPEGE